MTADTAAAFAPARVGAGRYGPRLTQGASIVTASMLASGVLTYVFLLVAARTLDREAYGRVGVLWAAVFLVAIVLFRPLEQTISRTVADRLARGQEARSAVRSVALVAAAVLAALGLAMAPAWGAISDRLFDGDRWLTLALAVAVAGYGVSYLVRGVLAGARRFGGYSTALLSDSVARLVLAAPLLVVPSARWAGVAVAGAGLAAVVAPLAVSGRSLNGGLRGTNGTPARVAPALRFAGPAVVIAGADQLLVNGGPLLVMLDRTSGAAAAAAFVFAATMLVRAPVWVFQGFSASLLPNLTHLAVSATPDEFRRGVNRTAAGLVVVGGCFTACAAIAGPAAMEIAYGSAYAVSAAPVVLLAAGATCYLAAGTFSQALLAVERGRAAACAWSAGAVCFVGAYEAAPGSPLLRVSVSLLCSCSLAAVALGSALTRLAR